MGTIQVLSFEVANLIAAGEVVDRPASAIKEMMENSIDAGAKNVTVEIQNGGVTFMRVSDNGCGIPPEKLDSIFQPFYTTKKNGSGIGLSLCRQIMLLHGGELTVESNPQKRSTTFIMTFPATE